MHTHNFTEDQSAQNLFKVKYSSDKYIAMSRNAYMKLDEIKNSNRPILDLSEVFCVMVFDFLWTGQGTFLVKDFHRPNGAKNLRFRNFPHTLTYPRGVENWQKSKSFSKIWLWKSWTFGYFLDRTRKQPHFQYIRHF